MSSRWALVSRPCLPSSLVLLSPTSFMVEARPASMRKRALLSGRAGSALGATRSKTWAELLPPYGSPGMPSQWNGAVSRRPRMGMVERGMIWLPPVTRGVSSTQRSWSVWPSGWQLAQENVPVVEAAAVVKAIRPRFRVGGVGSTRGMVACKTGLARLASSTTETEFSAALSTHARFCASSAIPCGTAPTCVRPSTAPLRASTVKSVSEPAAEATSVVSSSVTWRANGVARAAPGAGCCGGSGSRSKRRALPASTQVIWLRNGRFSSSLRPCFRVPARPLMSLRASVWAIKTRPLESTAMP